MLLQTTRCLSDERRTERGIDFETTGRTFAGTENETSSTHLHNNVIRHSYELQTALVDLT